MTCDPDEKKYTCTTAKCSVPNQVKKFLLSLVMEIKNYKAKTGNDPCDPI